MWPSRPTRRCRNRTGPGEVSLTAAAIPSSSGAATSSSTNASTRSAAYLQANCQPAGSTERMPISGRPPRWSSAIRSVIDSNMRGTIESSSPSSSHWRTTCSSWSSGAEEKARITCWAPTSRATAARSSGPPSNGTLTEPRSTCGEGSASRKPVGHEPVLALRDEPVRDLDADAAGADDQRRLADLTPRAGAALRAQEHDPATADEDQAEQPGAGDQRCELALVAEDDGERDDQHRRDGHGAGDGDDDVERALGDPHAVAAAQDEADQDERRQGEQRAASPSCRRPPRRHRGRRRATASVAISPSITTRSGVQPRPASRCWAEKRGVEPTRRAGGAAPYAFSPPEEGRRGVSRKLTGWTSRAARR